MYRITRLENGMTVATAEMPHMASVSVGLWVGTGGRHEPVELSGVSHFIEHMLFKGTKRRTARDLSAAIEGIGGYVNAYTSEESTCYYCKAQAGRFPVMLDVLMDMFLESRFAPAEMRKERAVIKEEISLYLDQPSQHVQDLLNELLWPDHPLGRCLTGTEKSLDRISRARLLRFYGGHYVGANTLLVVAGCIRHGEVVRRARPYASKFPKGKIPVALPVRGDETAPRFHCHTRDTTQTQLAIGFRSCSRHDDRRYALRLLNTMLGENMSSRLFQSLREDHGLAYSIQSSLSFHEDTGAFVISAGVEPDNLRRSMRYIARELRAAADKRPTKRELRQAYDYLMGQLELSLEATGSQANWIGENIQAYGRIVPLREIQRELLAVTPGDIRRLARDLFRPERICLALVSPEAHDDRLLRALRL